MRDWFLLTYFTSGAYLALYGIVFHQITGEKLRRSDWFAGVLIWLLWPLALIIVIVDSKHDPGAA